MRKLLYSAVVLTSLTTISSAEGLQQTFGSGANAFTMDFVTIGNPGNAGDYTGFGSVSYTYNIGKYEVSRDMITKANSEGNLGITLLDMSNFGGNGANKPAAGITWYEAARFVNYLNTSSGSAAAYKFDAGGNFQLWSSTDVGYNANNLFRNSLAKYFLTSTDEWHKAAYGSSSGTWYNYPTGSESRPAAVSGGTSGVVYGYQPAPADTDNAGGLSAWGTMGQGGNVQEWMETAYDVINDSAGEARELRGGAWGSSVLNSVSASDRGNFLPHEGNVDGWGFRIASVPEPSSLSLLALGGVVVALRRRR
jgi:formylglycine-generating enzyme required for sulfatase activity